MQCNEVAFELCLLFAQRQNQQLEQKMKEFAPFSTGCTRFVELVNDCGILPGWASTKLSSRLDWFNIGFIVSIVGAAKQAPSEWHI